MKYKKLMLVTFLLLAILTVGAVSASDDSDNITSTETFDSIESDVNGEDVISTDNDDVKSVLGDDEPDVDITSSLYYEYDGEPIVRYYFPEDVTGSISIYINGAENAAYSSEITTGNWVNIYDDDLEGFELEPGSYEIEVIYSGDENYVISSWSGTLEVTDELDDGDEPVTADFNITFGENHDFGQVVVKGRGTYYASFEFPSIAEGNVAVYVDDVYCGVWDIEWGDVFIEIETDNLAVGMHNVRFVYSGDSYFNSSTTYDSFNVTHIRFEVPYVLMPNSMGVSAYIALTVLPYDATGEVKLIVDNIEKATEAIDEGSVMYYLPDYLTYGNHTVTLLYQNGNYPSTTKNFSVESLIDNGASEDTNATGGEDTNATGGGDTNATGGEDKKTNIADVKCILSKAAFTYNGNVQKPTVTLTDGVVLSEGVDYTLQWSADSPKNAGTYDVTVTGTGSYYGTTKATFTINKAANPLAVKAKTAKVKYSAVKKKAQTLSVSKVVTFTKNGQGTLTYAKSSGNKKITINKKTGKVTIAKGIKKGTHDVKVKIKAAGNANYKASAYKPVTFKIIIK